MSKVRANNRIEVPDITLADAIRQLQIINGNIFLLKQGTQTLIDIVETGNLENAKKVIEICRLKEVLAALEPKT